ncbi:MAG: hypothetical protein KGJ60_01605 [Verrucomicrobiota bacterium]|nr:hypothetical protein [Verrucomicrobiota bacterium]
MLGPLPRRLAAAAAALVLVVSPARAVNLLENPSFELPPTGHNSVTNPATGWSYFSPPTSPGYFGDFWVEHSGSLNGTTVTAHSGNFFWKEWGALYSGTNNVAGIYQTFSSAPGSAYQAGGWLYINSGDQLGADCYVWLQVEFLDSSSNLLALDKSANFNVNAGLDQWIQYQVTNACDVTQPVSTGDPTFNTYAITGAVSQLVAPAGTALVRYRYCYLQFGSEGGSSYLDDADLEQLTGPIPPAIGNLYPQNMIFVPPSNGVSFDVSSPSGHPINTNAIHLVLNGTDVSTNLAFSGSSSNWAVFYSGLQSNTAYNASITVTDSFGFAANANTTFQTTWLGVPAPTYLWEAEDWDFTNGMYIDDPDLCNAPGGPNCYFGTVGTQNVDENSSGTPPNQFYRGATDGIGTVPSGDYTRPDLYVANRIDYRIDPFNGNPAFNSAAEWVNYTRDWPASTNWIIGRFANGATSAGSLQMSLVDPGVSTNVVGVFTMNPGPSWSTFQFVYLQDTNLDGQNATVVLNGRETLRVTSGGNMLPTFFMIVPAEVDLPYLTRLYPTGKHPFEYTNALGFVVTTLGAAFPAGGIQVILDGNDVSSNLVITGTASSNNVVYPDLAPNEMHTAVINVTNSLGHGISITNQFDTFSQSNYMVEAEDYDYNADQYVPSASYAPDGYASFVSVTNVDFHHTLVGSEPTDGSDYQYRVNGIPQQPAGDYLRQVFINDFAIDYQLYYYGGGDWANYTRDYPPGSYYVYARTSGLGPYTMTLGQVVSGLGTTNQEVKPLGQWSAMGANISTFAWVPLTDAGGVAPAVVNLPGVATLQVATPTGNCYPSYFMLVSASPISLSATRSGNDIHLSFPTQPGSNYRVFYRTNLATGSWSLLNSVLGDGTVKSVADSGPGDSQRFYKVTSP